MEGFFNYVVIEDGVVVGPGGGGAVPGTLDFQDEGAAQGTAPILDVTGAGASISVGGGKATLNVPAGASTIEVQDDGSKIGDALILDFAGTGIQSAFGATKATMTLPEISTELLYVHPDFIDNALFGQYSTVEAAITRAKALRGVGKFILIRVRAAIYQPTVQWDVHDGYGMIFDPGVLFDWSLWVGGTTFIQLSGFTYMKAAPLAFGIVGPHPFTGGKIVEALRVDPVTSGVSLVQVEGAFLWDAQGGATYGVHLNPAGGALGATPTFLFTNSLSSVASGVGSVVVEGDWSFSASGSTRIACVFASALKQVDSGTDYPSCDIDVSHLQAFGGVGVYDFEKSPNGSVIMDGSILKLKRTNMDWFTDLSGITEGPVNEENVLQYSYPDVAKPVEERYSLEAALLLIKSDIHNTTLGHDHDGATQGKKIVHTDLLSVGANDHHAEDHASRHSDGGADEIEVEDLATGETDTGHVLKPDGSGGLEWFDVDYQYNAVEGETLIPFGGGWNQKVRLSWTPPAAGNYFIQWQVELRKTDTAGECQAQLGLDDATQLGYITYEPEDNDADAYSTFSGFKQETLTAAAHTLDIDVREQGAGTGYVRRARVTAWRVS